MYPGIFLLSAATLALEIGLIRLFSLTQWYHFAFMAVAVALLGAGASGSLLAAAGPGDGKRRATIAAAGFVLAALCLYPAANLIPFDAYRLAIDRLQIAYLLLYVLALSAPFLCSGVALAALLSAQPEKSGALYGANLLGAGAGCLLALLALPAAGDGGMPLLVAGLGMLALVAFLWEWGRRGWPVITGSLAAACLCVLTVQPPALFNVRLSPYKALSIVSSFQGSSHVLSRWNAFSRVDVVAGPAIRAAPGLSLAFTGQLPAQPGLTVDGDNLHTIPTSAADAAYADFLPAAIPFRLRPEARALVVQAGTGQDVLVALRHGAQTVMAVEANPLVVQVARQMGSTVYDAPVQVEIDSGRSFLARSQEQFDVIVISLAESFHPVTSGDFSLSENYVYTVEAFCEYYRHLAADGLLVVTRWAQWPPSEDARIAALAAAALRRSGVAGPASQVVAFRSVQTLTMMVRRGPFLSDEIGALRRLWQEMSYDAVYYPGMTVDQANHFVVEPDARRYETFVALLTGRAVPDQSFDISASTDERPFFFHFFRWSQVGTILRNLGKTWQPFGGAGYLVLVALLVVTMGASLVLIVAPLLVRRGRGAPQARDGGRRRLGWLAYFVLLGLGFLFVEIPLLQRYILFLGQPVYATSVVLFALLVASGLGSLASARLGQEGGRMLLAAAGLVLVYPSLVTPLFGAALRLPLEMRLVVAALSLLPLGFVLGMPFAWGVRTVERQIPGFVPWAWAANGCASVIGSVLAAMVAVSWGFSVVLASAALAYALAWLSSRRPV